jgi:predicted dehydrogenase
LKGIKNVVVIGLGSMGERRVQLLRRNFPDISIIGVDVEEGRTAMARKKHGIEAYSSLDRALQAKQCQAAFVCTSPLSHESLIRKILYAKLHVFCELNLRSSGYLELIDLARTRALSLFLSSTMLYRAEIEYICDRIDHIGQKVLYAYHVGQYLPDWHPWEDYRDYFVSVKETNACREIFAIELPWIIKGFGEIAGLKVHKAKLTTLDLDFPDSYVVNLCHESGHIGSFTVDIVAKQPIRSLRIVSENWLLKWEGKPGQLQETDLASGEDEKKFMHEEYRNMRLLPESIVEQAYLSEIQAFFNEIENRTPPRYSFRKDIQTLSIIDQIEGYDCGMARSVQVNSGNKSI